MITYQNSFPPTKAIQCVAQEQIVLEAAADCAVPVAGIVALGAAELVLIVVAETVKDLVMVPVMVVAIQHVVAVAKGTVVMDAMAVLARVELTVVVVVARVKAHVQGHAIGLVMGQAAIVKLNLGGLL